MAIWLRHWEAIELMELVWYLTVLRRYWKFILLGTLVAGLIALLVSLLLPKSYAAQSELILFRSRVDVNFDPRLESVSEDEAVAGNNPVDPRRQTITAIALSADVLDRTLKNLPEDIVDEWTLADLRSATDVSVLGNLLQLSVSANDPDRAAAVANQWAETTRTVSNAVYRQEIDIDTMTVQAEETKAEYEVVQSELEAFLTESRIAELELSVEAAERGLADLQGAYQTAGQNELVFNLSARERIPVLQSSINALLDILNDSPGSTPIAASTQINLLYLQASAFSYGLQFPGELQLALPSDDERLTVNEATDLLVSLTDALTEQEARLSIGIEAQSEQVLSSASFSVSDNPSFAALQRELQTAKVALERETATMTELMTERELLWSNYLTLLQKVAELEITEQTEETEVLIAGRAIALDEPTGPNVIINVALGILLGAVLTSAYALLREHLKTQQA